MINPDQWPDADERREWEEGTACMFEDIARDRGLNLDNPLDEARIMARYNEILADSNLANYLPVRNMLCPHNANRKRGETTDQSIKKARMEFITRYRRAPTAEELVDIVRVQAKGQLKPLSLRHIQRHLKSQPWSRDYAKASIRKANHRHLECRFIMAPGDQVVGARRACKQQFPYASRR